MKFRFSWKITIICLLLAGGMLRASYWQWERHNSKQIYIKQLQARLALPVTDINSLLQSNSLDFSQFPYRRVSINGEYDFEKEMILRNRRHNDSPGVFILTPLKLNGTDKYIIVNRGFVPLAKSTPTDRKIFQKNSQVSFTGLLKETNNRRIFAPKDPPSGSGHPWVDDWLRVDLENISKQLPYPVLPVWAELMNTADSTSAEEQIIKTESGRDEIFFLAGKGAGIKAPDLGNLDQYPIAVFDTVVPADRHFGYIFEWAAMALMTVIIGIILQFRRPKIQHPSDIPIASKYI